ncbi:MAG: SIS domain-containing protein [Ruminococcaceae bacterium]|nr:SIS domain-containing protein [Oscillospiraceae bacterium]
MERLLKRYPVLEACKAEIQQAIMFLEQSVKNGGTILICGNGGSCSDSIHISGELLKGFLSKRPLKEEDKQKLGEMGEYLQYGIPAIPLPSLDGVISAFANDVDPKLVYAQLVWALGREGDVLLALTTSGNSENVVKACEAAKAKGMKVIGLTGERSCQLDLSCDTVIHAPATHTYQVQELHLPIYHEICMQLEENLFGND